MWLELTFVRYVNNMCKGRGSGVDCRQGLQDKKADAGPPIETTFLSGVNKVLRACSTGQTAVFGLLSGIIKLTFVISKPSDDV